MKVRHWIISALLLVIAVFLGYIIYLQSRPVVRLIQAQDGVMRKLPVNRYQVVTFDHPDSLSFAGEPVPMHDPDVRERFDREILINTYWNSNTVFLFKRANRWFPLIEENLKVWGIPEDFKYVTLIESGLLNVVSPRGATGFWQLMEETAKELGLEVTEEVDERYHPVKSTEAACLYLNKAHQKLGTWTNVAAAYNIGVAGLLRALNEQKVSSYYDIYTNEETSRYLLRVLAAKEILNNPEKYGYIIPSEHLYQPEATREEIVTSSINDLVEYAKSKGITYKTLKRHNPWLRKKTLTLKKPRTSYTITLPLDTAGVEN